MAVDVPVERLLAVVDHLYRSLRLQGEEAGVDLHGEVLPPAERSAYPGELQSNHLWR